MKKIEIAGIILCLALSLSFIIMSCGQQSSVVTTTTTTTTLSPVQIVVISGNLYSGTIRSSSIRSASSGLRIFADAGSPISGYSVVAVGTVDDKVYFPSAKTGASDGSFSIPIPAGESFYLEVIDDKGKFIAPVSFGNIGDTVAMAVTPEGASQVNLGKIVYESAKGAAIPTMEISADKLDAGSTAKHKSGEGLIPVGAGNLGRGEGEAKFSGQLKDKVDEDNDGLPDVVDIDDNGDGRVDGLDPNPRLPGRFEVKVAGVGNTNTFANFTRQYEEYPTYKNGVINTEQIDVATVTNLAIEVAMSQGTSPDNFSDVRVVDGPAWLSTARVASPGGSGPLWSDTQYRLEKESDRYDIHVIPNGVPEAGDVIKFRVTSTSGTSQEFISTLTYLYHNIPRLVAYSYTDGAAIVTKEGATDLDLSVYQTGEGGVSNVFGYKGANVTFILVAPKDDEGNYLTGMDWFLDGIIYYRADQSMFSAGAMKIYPATLESYPTFGTAYSYTFTTTTEPFSYFKVDLKSQNPVSGGGNAAQHVNFKKL